jgi:hypothetical protein
MTPFAKRFLIFAGCFFAALMGILGLTAVAKYKPYGVPEVLRPKWEAMQAEIAEAERLRREAAQVDTARLDVVKQPRSRAVVTETEHDFGMLDPGQSASHTFLIGNQGDAPLTLTAGDTSCKCTLSKTSRQLVPPGESAEITLTWNTGSEREFYRQYAVIHTNDPDQREIELGVSGTIRVFLGFSDEELLVPQVEPGHGAEAQTILYSQVLQQFEIGNVQSSLPGFHCIVEPLTDSELKPFAALSGFRLRFSTDATLEQGSFQDVIRVEVQGNSIEDEKEDRVREIAIRGRVTAPITFYGADLHSEHGLDLGIVSSDEGKVVKMLVRVRGDRVPQQMRVSRIEPAILEPELSPIQSRPGVFSLTIRVPIGADQSIFNREQQHGLVEVCDADNPSFKNWIPIYGAVVDI